jgi:hypothetical protein
LEYKIAHVAITSNFSDEVLKMILGANPEYAKIKDKNGLLPLHKAMDQERS